jgi:hypothetical protein
MTARHQICSSFLELESISIFIEGTLYRSLDSIMSLCLIQKYEASYNGCGIQSNPIQSNPIQSNPIQSNPIQSNPIQSNPIQSNPIQSNPIQSNPIQSKAIQTLYIFNQQMMKYGNEVV